VVSRSRFIFVFLMKRSVAPISASVGTRVVGPTERCEDRRGQGYRGMPEVESVPLAEEVSPRVKKVRARSKPGSIANQSRVSNRIVIGLVEDGQWIDAGAIREKARDAMERIASSGSGKDGGIDLALDAGEIEYLDAGVLQVLLAVRRECLAYGAVLSLLHVSPALEQWFAYAGAEDLLKRATEKAE